VCARLVSSDGGVSAAVSPMVDHRADGAALETPVMWMARSVVLAFGLTTALIAAGVPGAESAAAAGWAPGVVLVPAASASSGSAWVMSCKRCLPLDCNAAAAVCAAAAAVLLSAPGAA
jgi:hypothetical protein